MPNVRDIFNDCINDKTKYEVDRDNDYGIFGWCTIPSKTMVNMQYNEQALVVPSSYDHHNRVGGSNFLQMDSDLDGIYRKWSNYSFIPSARDSWCYLYNTRDWTYFMKPFFNLSRNSEVFTTMKDMATEGSPYAPKTSDHLNGIIFEPSAGTRDDDRTFGDIVRSCQFLAKAHHNENALKILSDRWTKVLSYDRLKELTSDGNDFNSAYGSEYDDLPSNYVFPFQDWVDDYNKTGSYIDSSKYRYNLGQAHAIDDFDEDSVWFYITMTEPVENLEQVVEIEDIMPYVFWWDNRGV